MTDSRTTTLPGSAARGTSLDDPRLAGTSLLVAVGTLVASAIALALFFGGAGAIFGPINDVLLGLTMVLLVPAILSVRALAAGRVGAWFTGVSWLGLAGLAVVVAGQVLLVTGLIPLAASFVTLGVGFVAFLVWAGAVALLALRSGLVARSVGGWAIALGGSLAAAAVTWGVLPMTTWSIFGIALLVAFTGWLVALGRDLRRISRPA